MEGIDCLEDEALRRATKGGSDRLLEMLLLAPITPITLAKGTPLPARLALNAPISRSFPKPLWTKISAIMTRPNSNNAS